MYVRLTGTKYPNNSDILITDIGQGEDGALQWITNLTECCTAKHTTSRALGEWFYPNGSAVGVKGTNQMFYKNRGSKKVYLHRRIGTPQKQNCYFNTIALLSWLQNLKVIIVLVIRQSLIACPTPTHYKN